MRKAQPEGVGFFSLGVPDDDLLSHGQSTLSSACCRFTVLFGMGRGGSGGLWSSGVEGLRRQGLADVSAGGVALEEVKGMGLIVWATTVRD